MPMASCAAGTLWIIDIPEEILHCMKLFLDVFWEFEKHILLSVLQSQLSMRIAGVYKDLKVVALVEHQSDDMVWGGNLDLLLSHMF